jgi:hypothetical protein
MIVIPFQGHGWGYRYLHPYLGSFALLAGFGYRHLRTKIGDRVDGAVLISSGLTALVTIPLLFLASSRLAQAYVAVENLVSSQQAPLALIDTFALPTSDRRWAPNAIETVRNFPDLSNRPRRFSSRAMTPEMLERLCHRGKVALIGRAEQRRVGFAMNASADSPLFAELVRPVQSKMPDCFVSPIIYESSMGRGYRLTYAG